MTDSTLVFWAGALCSSLFWVGVGALIVLAQDKKLSERVASLEKAIADMTKKDEKKSRV